MREWRQSGFIKRGSFSRRNKSFVFFLLSCLNLLCFLPCRCEAFSIFTSSISTSGFNLFKQDSEFSTSAPKSFRSKFHAREEHHLFMKTRGEDMVEDRPNKLIETIGKSTSAFVALTFFGILAWKRDALMFVFFTGAIGNAILSKVLKRIIDQSRPRELAHANIDVIPKDPGMPSSHAMSLGFIGTFTSCNLPQLALPIMVYVVVSLFYRVKINLHSKEQVLVGLTLGCEFYTTRIPTNTTLTYLLNLFDAQ